VKSCVAGPPDRARIRDFVAQDFVRIGRGVESGMFAEAKIPHIAG